MRFEIIVFLYFLPGVLFSLALKFFRKPIEEYLKISPWLTQMILVEVVLFGSMLGVIVFFGSDATQFGLNKINWYALALSPVYGEISARVLKLYRFYVGEGLQNRLDKIPIFKIPDWHYQKLTAPSYPKYCNIALIIAIQGSNVIIEELYFRGFLYQKTTYLGSFNWIFNGILFILYHFFQASKTYALFPLGLLIAGYYALTKDIYGCMIVHYFLNTRTSIAKKTLHQ